MYVVFVNFFKFVICCDFFCHSKHIFTFCIHNFVFFFLKQGPETVKASGLIKSQPTPVRVSVWTCATCTCTTPFIMVCLSPSVLSVLFWSHTTCKHTTPFITVYHRQYPLFCFELIQYAHAWWCSSLSITFRILCFVPNWYNMQMNDAIHHHLTQGFSKTWPAGHTQPVSSCIQSSPWSYSNYRMWPSSVSKNFLYLNWTLSNVHRLKTAWFLWKLFYNTNQQKQNTSVTFKFN